MIKQKIFRLLIQGLLVLILLELGLRAIFYQRMAAEPVALTVAIRRVIAGIRSTRPTELYASQDSATQFSVLRDSSAEGIDSLSHRLIGQYLSNLKNMRDLAVRNGIKPFFFIQPTPFYNYPNKKNDPICDGSRSLMIEKDYPVLEKSTDSIGNCVFLGNLPANKTGYPFIDRFHYSPSMNKEIADSILAVVGKSINGY